MRAARRAQMAAAGQGKVPVGISTGTFLATLSSANMDVALGFVQGLGVRWVRETIEWPTVQPANSSTFDWAQWDLFASKCASRGLRIIACVGGSPAWARPATSGLTNSAPPDNAATFGTFVAAAVARYGSQVRHWEIWNEPNQPLFWGGTTTTPNDVDPAKYTQLLEAAHTALKANNAAHVVLGGSFSPAPDGAGPDGLYMAPTTFLDAMLGDGAGAWMDGVAHHPYTYPARPSHFHTWSPWSQIADTSPSLVSVMAAHGTSKRIWITEVGAPTYGSGTAGTVANNYGAGMDPFPTWVDEQVQAQIVDDAIRLARANPARFGAVMIYTLIDLAAPGVDTDREKHFGVLEGPTSGTPKDAAAALTAAVTATGGP